VISCQMSAFAQSENGSIPVSAIQMASSVDSATEYCLQCSHMPCSRHTTFLSDVISECLVSLTNLISAIRNTNVIIAVIRSSGPRSVAHILLAKGTVCFSSRAPAIRRAVSRLVPTLWGEMMTNSSLLNLPYRAWQGRSICSRWVDFTNSAGETISLATGQMADALSDSYAAIVIPETFVAALKEEMGFQSLSIEVIQVVVTDASEQSRTFLPDGSGSC
jgi:hypothetical protein